MHLVRVVYFGDKVIKENPSRVRFPRSTLVSVIVTVRSQLRQLEHYQKITRDSVTGRWGFGLTVDTSSSDIYLALGIREQ